MRATAGPKSRATAGTVGRPRVQNTGRLRVQPRATEGVKVTAGVRKRAILALSHTQGIFFVPWMIRTSNIRHKCNCPYLKIGSQKRDLTESAYRK